MAVLLAVTCAGPAFAQSNAAVRVGVVGVGDVAPALVEHARAWSEQNLAVKVDLLPAEKLKGKTLDDIAAQAVEAGGVFHAHTVAIAMPPEGVMNHGMRLANGRAAVVNVRPMQADKPSAEVLEKRIERQALRAISLMLDIGTCENPQCSLARYQGMEQLDGSGRNLCPPCLSKLQKKAGEEHLEMLKDSPFYLAP
jgi:hypothetical protein